MSTTLKEFHDKESVRATVAQLESEDLAHDLGGTTEGKSTRQATDELRVAAVLALVEQVGTASVDQLLRSLAANETGPEDVTAISVFDKWHAYFSNLEANDAPPSVDDVILFVTAGLMARQQVDVRSALHTLPLSVDDLLKYSGEAEWSDEVRARIGLSLLFMVRQSSKADLRESIRSVDLLAEKQKTIESAWLEKRSNPSSDAFTLLGYYHVARAVARTSEFLMAGSVESDGVVAMDVGPELRRLLTRAGEYLGESTDVDVRFWLNCVSVILWTLRTDSLWVAGRGISERLDKLLSELVKGERERNLFSLLPSQQEAIRASLMDPSRVAVVLQMPTSAGKTLLAEFSILQTFDAFKERSRVVYIVPTRALVTQTYQTLAEDLGPLGIDVVAAASAFEEDPYELELLRGNNGVVVATPEKVDLLVRSDPEWFEHLRLVVVDEAHLLHDSERGVRLELLLANLRRERPEARVLLMTPFIENAREIATWLGGTRGLPITVQWRPVRLFLGLAELTGKGASTGFMTHWREPHRPNARPKSVRIPAGQKKSSLGTTRNRVSALARRFSPLGSVLALYSGSRKEPEISAWEIAESLPVISPDKRPASLRVAIALAEDEFGEGSTLARCLERGAAYHHSALSPMLRYLIEDQVRCGRVKFIAATTTLAQGMNFPVAAVVVHSVHKPHGKGNLSGAEFWNIAGRAGRAGLVEKGLVIFANEDHREHWERYSGDLSHRVRSALLDTLVVAASQDRSIKDQYREFEELRPFIQYLAHAAASSSVKSALDDLEELLQASLANAQAQTPAELQTLRTVARRYLSDLANKNSGLLKVADRSGLGSFNFEELYAKIRNDAVLSAGPSAIVEQKTKGIAQLIEALRWLPELKLAIGLGAGDMNVDAVARVVQGWMDGRRIVELADEFPGKTRDERVRNAGSYVFGTVSQTVSWGAHAYLRGWSLGQEDSGWEHADAAMLPAYIQYGVHSPEAAVASLLSVPRPVAEPIANLYRERFGRLTPETAESMRSFMDRAGSEIWDSALKSSSLKVSGHDLRLVWRQMRGLGSRADSVLA